jgi:hypothetical protein
MTFARTRDAARSARFLPATGSSRLASVIGSAADRTPVGALAPAQQAAQALIGAEQALAQAQSRYVEAKAAWIAESRGSRAGEENGTQLLDAERGLAMAEESRQRARDRVEQLRHRLDEQRRQQVPSAGGPNMRPQDLHEPQGSGGHSIFARLLRR